MELQMVWNWCNNLTKLIRHIFRVHNLSKSWNPRLGCDLRATEWLDSLRNSQCEYPKTEEVSLTFLIEIFSEISIEILRMFPASKEIFAGQSLSLKDGLDADLLERRRRQKSGRLNRMANTVG